MGMTVIRRVLTKKLLSELEKGRTRWVRMKRVRVRMTVTRQKVSRVNEEEGNSSSSSLDIFKERPASLARR